ncbi:lysophospholipid acyltransferase family protein [Brachybacterium muris]|uniref:Acyl-phosphate glycerol 3-phosphate acyltransferase n=1 Tax=Brachybacterium muris UCD-AY4 TaxID=1249481 RepID=A0A022KTP2_9MICO|nr:lysophospholipid acyltransferase family protein [Brachybacterium muris]EYT47911.1 acyl-phosphate glycerol 3-phosphate acyltransferase [Brachybacterium muris UCD-AY4]MCT1654871.1 1-acyl-sn-glycerol-3-phosphate acyltransferase [Brachybacterium muris]MCT2296957.1 1-acyl-sn-glycerol-3-phosphate acyltransferase [Brachybacterium muris]
MRTRSPAGALRGPRGRRAIARSWDLGAARPPERRSGAIIGALQFVLRPALSILARPVWAGAEHLQRPGGAVVCGNHLGPFDAFAYGHLLHAAGVAPRFLAKESLFRIPVLGTLIRRTGQIPVLRGTSRSTDALDAARAALRRGEMIMVFPEGTYSRDPDSWPMQARLGAARLALDTQVPLIPVACWGSHLLWPQGSTVPRPGPGRRVMVRVGEPIRAERSEGESTQQAAVRITAELMDTITQMLAELRHEEPPARRYDPRKDAYRPEEGHPRQRRPRRQERS